MADVTQREGKGRALEDLQCCRVLSFNWQSFVRFCEASGVVGICNCVDDESRKLTRDSLLW